MKPSKPFRTLNDALRRNASDFGSKRALLLPGSEGRWVPGFATWAELAGWVNAVANHLDRLSPRQRRLIHTVENKPEDVLIALACQAMGIVEIPVDVDGGDAYVQSCRDRVQAFWLDESEKRAIVEAAYSASASRRGEMMQLAATAPPVDETDDALVLWTSGTSGQPKGVVLSHGALVRNAAAKLRAVPQSINDVRLTLLSIAHAYARTCDLGTWLLSGCTLAIDRGFQGWQRYCSDRSPEELGVDGLGPTLCNLVPSLAGRVLDQASVPPTLRLVGCGGAPLTAERFRQWRQRNVIVIQGYGLTEAGPVIASQTPDDSIPGHAGRFVQGWEYRLHDGRLSVRGKHQMSRYVNDADATQRRVDQEGWLDTGDRVEIDQQSGQLKILGRCDDRIVLSNGHKIDPLGLERRFEEIAGVDSVVVCPDSGGRFVELWIETGKSALPIGEVEKITQSLPRWEQPRQVNRLVIPEPKRRELFNRKGAIRRTPMLEYLHSLSGSRIPPDCATGS